MSKIVIPEFVVCHKFSGNIRGILIEQREKCDFTHNVSSKELSIFIGFTSSCFNIDALILKITKKRQKKRPFQFRVENSSTYFTQVKIYEVLPDDFEHEVAITFAINQQKKMVCFWSLYEHYRENLKIKNCIIDLKRKDPKTIIKLVYNEKDIDVKKIYVLQMDFMINITL